MTDDYHVFLRGGKRESKPPMTLERLGTNSPRFQ